VWSTDGTGVAFVGSSNLSHSALPTGIERNYRAVSKADAAAFQ
jgi:HKD family nuclease